MTTDDDSWVKSAMDDTDLVAHLLFKLRHAAPSPSPSPPPKTWTIRQRRSKPPPPPPVKKSPATRASPTTPLSWSGATSVSGGGIEESSRPTHDAISISRSKVNGPSDTTPSKRPRKKKTLAELKEDEMALLRERKQLKRQLATLQATCQKQRMENESLKKMKKDVQSQRQESVDSEVNDRMEGKKQVGFVLPDLNIPAGEDY